MKLRTVVRGAVGSSLLGAGAALLVSGGSALAASPVTASVTVNPSLSISGVTSSFNIAGPAGSTAAQNGAVRMTVTTNDPLGYTVTVQAAGASMTGARSGNSDTIPVSALGVRESGGLPAFAPVSNLAPIVTHTQATPSASGGDTVSNDYQIVIPPTVSPDTYSVTLNYVVTAL